MWPFTVFAQHMRKGETNTDPILIGLCDSISEIHVLMK